MKKISVHPAQLILMASFIALLLSLIHFQKNIIQQGFLPSYQVVEGTLYYLNKPVFNADIKSFKVLPGGYSVDANRVYYDGREVIGIDRQSFEVIDYGIAKDINGLWVFNRLLHKGATNYKSLGNLYYQADNEVYYFELEVKGADINTFKPLPKDYLAQDKNNYYYRGRVVEIES